MTILITGGTGFVGAAVVDHLSRAGRAVAVFAAHPAPPRYLPATVETILGDVADAAAVAAAIRSTGATRLIHAAAITAGPNEERERPERVVAVNVGGTAAVLKAAAECGVTRVVCSSSGALYPPTKAGPERFRVDLDPPAPAALYGLSKHMAELTARRLAAVYGLEVPMLRLAGVYGPFERDTGVREILSAQAQVVMRAEAGEPIVMSRPAFGGWLYARDAAAGLVALVDAPLGEPTPVFDLGGPEVFSVLAFAERIAAAYPGVRAGLGEGDGAIRFQWPHDRNASDFTRLAAATGFTPRFGLEAAAEDYLAWLRDLRAA